MKEELCRTNLEGIIVPTQSHHPNAFTTAFLDRLAERDEPPTAGDADVAGPWRIEPIPGHGFGLFRVGESLARGFAPTAVFPSRWLALLMAGILPGTGKDPLLLLSKQPDAHGAYPVALAGGGDDGDGGDDGTGGRGPVGFFQLFDEKALDALNLVIHLIQAPECLAYVLEAAGSVALVGASQRCRTVHRLHPFDTFSRSGLDSPSILDKERMQRAIVKHHVPD